jgi:hypothetical protein
LKGRLNVIIDFFIFVPVDTFLHLNQFKHR